MKITSPTTKKLDQILPQNPILLMGAGPVPIPEEVAKANTKVISHLGEPMNSIISNLQEMAQYVFQTKSSKIFGISGPSSAAMEMATTSLLWPGRKVLVLNLGTFSARFTEIARGIGAEVKELFPEPLSPFRAHDVKKELEANQYDVLTIVQGETSCGIKNVELESIVKLAKQYNVRTIVDSVCTLSTMPLYMDEWNIDIVVTGGQKGLSSIAGVSLIAFSEEAYEFVSNRTAPMPHWCLDPRRAFRFWCKQEYHYTAPVNGILALYEALRLICEETLERRHARHARSSELLQSYLEGMGFELHAPKSCRLNSVLAIKNMPGIDAKKAITHLKEKFAIEISGAFGLDIIRVGQMGEQCRSENLMRVLKSIGLTYQEFGAKVDLTQLQKDLENPALFSL